MVKFEALRAVRAVPTPEKKPEVVVPMTLVVVAKSVEMVATPVVDELANVARPTWLLAPVTMRDATVVEESVVVARVEVPVKAIELVAKSEPTVRTEVEAVERLTVPVAVRPLKVAVPEKAGASENTTLLVLPVFVERAV